MQFRKPPVVEVSITVDFDPNSNKQKFDLNLANEFLQAHRAEFPHQQFLQSRQVQLSEAFGTDLPKVTNQEVQIKAFRLWNEDRSHMLHLGDDTLSYHILRSDHSQPSYSVVRDALQPKLNFYEQLFHPRQIRQMALHYLDIIDIPIPQSGRVEFSDYFAFNIDPPENPFGLITALNCQFQTDCPEDLGPLIIEFAILPPAVEDSQIRFRVDWHKVCEKVNSLNSDQVWNRLEGVHDYLRRCFQTALTPRTLALFEPIEQSDIENPTRVQRM